MFVKSRLINVLVFVLIATMGGVLGAFFYYTSLAPELKLVREITESPRGLFGSRFADSGIYSPGDISRLNTYTATSIAGIFKKKNQTGKIFEDIYLPGERLGLGIVISMDGWIMVRPQALGGREAGGLTVNIGKNFYNVEKIVFDGTRKINFIKVAAANLSALDFGDSDEIKFGDGVFIVAGRNQLQSSVVSDTAWQEIKGRDFLIQDSEETARRILVRGKLSQDWLGAPIVNYKGEVLALVERVDINGNSVTIPINNFKKSIQQLFAGTGFKQNYLGLAYIDLNTWRAPDASLIYGFLVQTKDRLGGRGITRGSPAEAAGFNAGDIILKINETLIRGPFHLGEILDDFKVGETVNFTVKREDKEMLLKAVLGEK